MSNILTINDLRNYVDINVVNSGLRQFLNILHQHFLFKAMFFKSGLRDNDDFLWSHLDYGYICTQTIAIRRLTRDRDDKVVSLNRIAKYKPKINEINSIRQSLLNNIQSKVVNDTLKVCDEYLAHSNSKKMCHLESIDVGAIEECHDIIFKCISMLHFCLFKSEIKTSEIFPYKTYLNPHQQFLNENICNQINDFINQLVDEFIQKHSIK